MKEKSSNIVIRISSPKGLAMALSYKGGLRNTIVQLVELDLDQLQYIQLFLLQYITGIWSYNLDIYGYYPQ